MANTDFLTKSAWKPGEFEKNVQIYDALLNELTDFLINAVKQHEIQRSGFKRFLYNSDFVKQCFPRYFKIMQEMLEEDCSCAAALLLANWLYAIRPHRDAFPENENNSNLALSAFVFNFEETPDLKPFIQMVIEGHNSNLLCWVSPEFIAQSFWRYLQTCAKTKDQLVLDTRLKLVKTHNKWVPIHYDALAE